MTEALDPDWPAAIFDALKVLNVRQVAYVPDAGHAHLIEMCGAEPTMTLVPLTTEEEGVALLAGAWLGGERGVLLMQSSGVGNCANQLAFARAARFPLLTLVTMRGEAAEKNPWQIPMGQATAPLFETMGGEARRIDAAADAGPTVAAAGQAAFGGDAIVAVLIAQDVIGVKSFEAVK
jgi:sulfopyruvate decarboxylase TPP-binding subunit